MQATWLQKHLYALVGFWQKKSKKTFTDGETVKRCFLERADSLFAEFPNKREIQKQISHLQLSHQTVARRVQILSANIATQLHQNLRNASGFSLALDESCDITRVRVGRERTGTPFPFFLYNGNVVPAVFFSVYSNCNFPWKSFGYKADSLASCIHACKQ